MADAFDSKNFMLHYYLVLYGILYYEYLCTLNKEYWTIWKAKWSVVKILFLVNRYLMLVISVIILVGFRLNWPTERCQSYYIPWQTILPVIVAAAGSVILLLRAYAVWGQARWVLYVLVPLLIAHIGISTGLAATHVTALEFPGGAGPCMVRAKNAVMDIYCVMPMIFDLTTSGLCIYRSFKLQRDAGDMASSLLRNFTKHGTLYAVGAAIANISNLAFMAITSKQLGLPTVPSNGGMLCTVFSSIFISRLAMSLKDENEARRRANEGMIPLSSVRASGGGSDYKGGRESNLSGATFVNVPTLKKTRRDSDHSLSSQKGEASSYSLHTDITGKVSPATTTSAARVLQSSTEKPEEHVQWAKRDPRLLGVVRVQSPPSGPKATRTTPESKDSLETVDLRSNRGSQHSGSNPAVPPFGDISPNMVHGGRIITRADERMPSTMKMISSKRPLEAIAEASPNGSDGSFMERAAVISPYIYDSVPPNTARSDEVSPTECSWLGEGLKVSPSDAEDPVRTGTPDTASLTTSPLYAQFPLDDKSPATAEVYVTAPTSAASNMTSPQPESAHGRFALPRVPAPSPVTPHGFSGARASPRRASWIMDVQAKLQRVQA